VILLEFGLRIAGRSPTNMTDGFFVQYDDSYRLRPNLTKVTRWPGYSYVAHTNQYGFRDRSQDAHDVEGEPYAVFLGASQTFGNGVEFEDSFVGIVAEWLSLQGIDTLNMAIGGHHLVEQENLLRDFLSDVGTMPEYVFVCLDPVMISKFDTSHDDVIVKAGYVFNRDNWLLPYVRVMLGNISAAYGFVRDNFRRAQARFNQAPDTGNDFYLGLYGDNNPIHSATVVARLFARMDALVSYVQSEGATPVFVYVPTVASLTIQEVAADAGLDPARYDPLYYGNLVKEYAESRGVLYINPHALLFRLHDEGMKLSFDLDAHYNKETNAIVGNYVTDQLAEHGIGNSGTPPARR